MYAISDFHVISIHVYNRGNLITQTSIGYHYNKQALHIGPSTLYTVCVPQFPFALTNPTFCVIHKRCPDLYLSVGCTPIVGLTIKSNPFIITRNVGVSAIKVIFRTVNFKSQKVNLASMYASLELSGTKTRR